MCVCVCVCGCMRQCVCVCVIVFVCVQMRVLYTDDGMKNSHVFSTAMRTAALLCENVLKRYRYACRSFHMYSCIQFSIWAPMRNTKKKTSLKLGIQWNRLPTYWYFSTFQKSLTKIWLFDQKRQFVEPTHGYQEVDWVNETRNVPWQIKDTSSLQHTATRCNNTHRCQSLQYCVHATCSTPIQNNDADMPTQHVL